MQADEAPADEVAHRHTVPSPIALGGRGLPSVVVGIAHHETGEDEEEIDGQKAVEHVLFRPPCGKGDGLEQMIAQYGQGCHTTQAVKDVIMGFGVIHNS